MANSGMWVWSRMNWIIVTSYWLTIRMAPYLDSLHFNDQLMRKPMIFPFIISMSYKCRPFVKEWGWVLNCWGRWRDGWTGRRRSCWQCIPLIRERWSFIKDMDTVLMLVHHERSSVPAMDSDMRSCQSTKVKSEANNKVLLRVFIEKGEWRGEPCAGYLRESCVPQWIHYGGQRQHPLVHPE